MANPLMTVQLEIKPVDESTFEEALALQAYAIRALSEKYYNQQQIEAIVQSQAAGRRNQYQHSSKLIREQLYGAWIDNKLVAIASISIFWRSGSVQGVYVHPDFARRGIGRQMLMKLEEIAIQQKCSTMHTFSSLTAVKLYESVGFARVCSDVINCGQEKVAGIFMNKSLKAFQPKQNNNSERLTVICSIAACIAVVIVFM